MPLWIDAAERAALFGERESPEPMLDLLGAAGFRAAGAAVEVGVFTALAGGPLPLPQLASRLGCDETGLGILLAVLARFGYAEEREGAWAATPMAAQWFGGPVDGGFDYRTVQRFWTTLLAELWGDLPASIRQGRPARPFYAWLEEHPATLADFHAMLAGAAGLTAPVAVELAALGDGPLSLLDLGGGHAGHTIGFCRHHPELRGVVMDYAGALGVGRANVEAAGLGSRIELRAGDFERDELGGPYDLVLLMSIVHGLQPEANIALLSRIARALRPGGAVLILEQLDSAPDESPPVFADAFQRVFKLNLFHLLGARTYDLAEVSRWLAAAGLAAPEVRVAPLTGDSLLLSRRPVKGSP